MFAATQTGRHRLAGRLLWIGTLLSAAIPCEVAAAPSGNSTAAQLREWRFAAAPLPLPEGGLRFESEGGRFHLESGEVYLSESIGEAGRPTGLVFEGAGRFTLDVPDWRELDNLRRIFDDPALEAVELEFRRLVVATTDREITAGWPPGSAGAKTRVHPLVRKRREHALGIRRVDIDARLAAGLFGLGELYLRADFETRRHGWVTFEFEPLAREEIRLERYRSGYQFLEVPVSLDRAADRRPDGTPATERKPLADITHVELAIDLHRPGRDPRQGRTRALPVNARIRAEVDLEAGVSGPSALVLDLHPWAKVERVAAGDAELEFEREALGERFSFLDKRLHDRSLTIFLGAPLEVGEPLKLTIEYDLELVNYAPGRLWYPGFIAGFDDRHTGRMEVVGPARLEVRAMGRQVAGEAGDEQAGRSLWAVERPVKMLTFAFAEKPRTAVAERADSPRVVASSPQGGEPQEVADDVADSLAFYQELLDDQLDIDELFVTSIAGGHGQAFEGFVHLAERDFLAASRGPSERFRAHEVAHQWWGHRIGFATYRDQWLSEALAEYSSLLFLESEVERGTEYADEIRALYRAELDGSLRGSQSRFARDWLIAPGAAAHLSRLGPITLGVRASTVHVPQGYVIQSYHKGALVLHMIRRRLERATGAEDAFVVFLRRFVASYRDRSPSTDDFEAELADFSGEDWSWFFDQWVHGTAIPTYRWRQVTRPAGSGWELTLTVEQENVPEGFRMPVPVRVELASGAVRDLEVLAEQESEKFVFALDERPARVIFNPRSEVLARVRSGR